MPSWFEVFAVFAICHTVGDYLLQTEWQAVNKRGGLGSDPTRRRALLMHCATYTVAFVPALVWLGAEDIGVGMLVALLALIFIPHVVQDDGRLLTAYMTTVKGTPSPPLPIVALAVDQSFHLVVLFGLALFAVV